MERIDTLNKASAELSKIAKQIQNTGDMQTISELERRGVENMRVIEAALAFSGREFYNVVQDQRRAVNAGTFKPKETVAKKEQVEAKKPSTKKSSAKKSK